MVRNIRINDVHVFSFHLFGEMFLEIYFSKSMTFKKIDFNTLNYC